jgi:hypothetical protein
MQHSFWKQSINLLLIILEITKDKKWTPISTFDYCGSNVNLLP